MPESLSDVKGLPIGMLILNFSPHIVGINWRVQLRILDVECLELPRAAAHFKQPPAFVVNSQVFQLWIKFQLGGGALLGRWISYDHGLAGFSRS
jgi:hypothetical protein